LYLKQGWWLGTPEEASAYHRFLILSIGKVKYQGVRYHGRFEIIGTGASVGTGERGHEVSGCDG
jgi:hypothetical protein